MNDANGHIMKPGKTVVAVAMIREYASGTPVFVRCYRKSNNWTLPFTELDYTDDTNPLDTMISVVKEMQLKGTEIVSATPIVDMIDEDKPGRVIIYKTKVVGGLDAYQLYTSPDDELFRISRFMHQNQLFSVLKGVSLTLYIDHIRSE